MSGESPLRRLTLESRRALLDAVRARRIGPTSSALSLRPIVGAEAAEIFASELKRLAAMGLTPALLEELLSLLSSEESPARPALVWTGPEDASATTRDTGVVVRELFQRANAHVLVAGFAVYQGADVFRVLADRMENAPALEVEMYLNVERAFADTTAAEEILRVFAERFRTDHWPGGRMPRVYYDPRALEPMEPGKKRAAMHAKCVVVDGRYALVGSANFTEAAQQRNIEAGVLIEDPIFASSLVAQFAWLARAGHVRSVPGLGSTNASLD
jgi:hypothetical protein